jgi:hypothetical protein
MTSARHSPPERRGILRWREPRTLGGTLALFGAGYLVFQPLMLVFRGATFREPLPVAGAVAWRAFLVCVAGLGLAAGALWHGGGPPEPRRWREASRSTARWLPITTMVSAQHFASFSPPAWAAFTLSNAAVMGVAFHWTERWMGPTRAASVTANQGGG